MERSRSRRDCPPLSRRVASDSDSYTSASILREPLSSGRRSTSVTSQFRSKSPPRQQSTASAYSPTIRSERESADFVSQFPPRTYRSATGTPQGSPKKRQLPIIPPARERLAQVSIQGVPVTHFQLFHKLALKKFEIMPPSNVCLAFH